MRCLDRGLVIGALFCIAFASACKKDDRPSPKLPPASDWQAPPMSGGQQGAPASGHAGSNPHGTAGMNTGASDPHAGLDMGAMGAAGGDPHAGLDMNAAGGDPHAGVDMGGGHAGAIDPMDAVQPPDPNRPIDDSKFLKGAIVVTKETADRVKPGAIIFISVRPIEPVTGEIIGGPIAVERIDVQTLPTSFHLSERNAMSAGTQFAGDVLISARVDADGEARSRSPGDVEGTVRATIPSDKLELKLDTILR